MISLSYIVTDALAEAAGGDAEAAATEASAGAAAAGAGTAEAAEAAAEAAAAKRRSRRVDDAPLKSGLNGPLLDETGVISLFHSNQLNHSLLMHAVSFPRSQRSSW